MIPKPKTRDIYAANQKFNCWYNVSYFKRLPCVFKNLRWNKYFWIELNDESTIINDQTSNKILLKTLHCIIFAMAFIACFVCFSGSEVLPNIIWCLGAKLICREHLWTFDKIQLKQNLSLHLNCLEQLCSNKVLSNII